MCLKFSGKCTKEDRAAQRDNSIELQRIFSRIQQKEKEVWICKCSIITLEAVQCHKPTAAAAKSLQSCPTLCDPTDGSPLGSSVPTRKTILKKLKITNTDKDVEK